MSADNFLIIYKRKDGSFSVHECSLTLRCESKSYPTAAWLEKDRPLHRDTFKTFAEAADYAANREDTYFIEGGTETHVSAQADEAAFRASPPAPAPAPEPVSAPEPAPPASAQA